MKVIQLRGTNATGKTTAMRQFISRGGFVIESIIISKKLIEYHYNPDRKIIVLGRYDKAVSGGIDGHITDKNLLRDTIMRLMKTVKPEVLLFEGIVYGVTFQFAYELARALKTIGVEYRGICLIPPLEVVFDRLAGRNGDKPVNYMSVQNKWFTTSRAYQKLKKNGLKVKAIDTTNIPYDQMYRIIEDEI